MIDVRAQVDPFRRAWWIAVGAAVAAALGAGVTGNNSYLVWAAAAVGGAAVIVLAFDRPRWILTLHLALLVGYVVDTLREQHSFPVATTALTVLLVFAVSVRHLLGLERLWLPQPEAWLIGGVFATMALSAVFADDFGAARTTVVEFVKNAVLVFLLLILLNRFRYLVYALWAWVVPSAILAALAIAQQASGTPGRAFGGFADASEVDGAYMRTAGPTSANYFAQQLVVAAVLAAYVALADRRPRIRVLAGVAAFVCTAGVVLTASRTALIALALLALLIALIRGVRPVPLALGLGLVATVATLAVPSDVQDRFSVLFRAATEENAIYEDRALTGRLSENLAAVKMFADYPLVGVGPGNYKTNYVEYSQSIGLDPRNETRSPHSFYLEALSELGLPGALILIGMVGVALVGAWRSRYRLGGERALIGEGVALALLAYMICGVTLHLSFERYFWVIVALAFAVRRLGLRESSTREVTATGRRWTQPQASVS